MFNLGRPATLQGAPASPRDYVEQALTRLPKFPSLADLREVFPSEDVMLDAYVRGWLPKTAVEALESHPDKLQCWLLARLLRLSFTAEARP